MKKKTNPPGKNANGAVYLFNRDIFDIFDKTNNISDFSTDVIQCF